MDYYNDADDRYIYSYADFNYNEEQQYYEDYCEYYLDHVWIDTETVTPIAVVDGVAYYE